MPRRTPAGDRAAAWEAVGTPALCAVAALLLLGLLLALMPDGLTLATLQPAESAGATKDWGWATRRAPGWVALFFLGDTLFALALGWAFLRLWRALPGGPLAAIGLGAALLKAAADVLENLLHLRPALEALVEGSFAPPPADILIALAAMKRAAAAATGLAFAVAFAGDGAAARIGRLLLAAMGLAAALGFLVQELRLAHVTLLFGFLVFLLWYRRRAADELR